MTDPGALETIYRSESRRVLATLVRLLGGFDAAEDALQEAFAAAAASWPVDGLPVNPYAWLVSAGRFRLLSQWRRQNRVDNAMQDPVLQPAPSQPSIEGDGMDDQLCLIFMCCHPDLPPDGRVAVTLREVAGLTTEDIARAFLTPVPTLAQRIVRTKAKIRDMKVPFAVPETADLPARIDSVLQVIYLIFNEGYASAFTDEHIRAELCTEAVRLGRLVAQRLDDSEVMGLLALMLLHQARRTSRLDQAGDIVLLEDQDRSLWDRALIVEGQALINRALQARRAGPYLIQAAIADVHVRSATFTDTDWDQIVGLYDTLQLIAPSPFIALNRAVAIGMRSGAQKGLREVEASMAQGRIADYHPAHLARAEMLRRLDRLPEARSALLTAYDLTQQAAERRLILKKIHRLQSAEDGNTSQPILH